MESLRCERGQGLVEFAMVLPFLAALMLVFIQFGKAINYWQDLTHVANEAARSATVGAPGITTAAAFKSSVCSMLETGELRNGSGEVDATSVSISYPNGSTAQDVGDPVKVTVSTKYHWFKFFQVTIPFATTTIQGSATMRLERDERTNAALAANTGKCP